MKRMRIQLFASLILVAGGICLVTQEVRADDVVALRKELNQLKQQVQLLEAKLDTQTKTEAKVLDAGITPGKESSSVADVERQKLADEVTERVLTKVQPNIVAASKSTPGEFNPAMGLMLDAVGSAKEQGKNNFEFRSAEIALSANADPFVKGYANFNGTSDGVEVEEAAIVTTALPYNLNVKGGRFFADFGRLSKFHDHDLPTVNRPTALDRLVGGESQADGVEINYLLPIDHYVSLTAGAYNKIGADNDRLTNTGSRGWNEMTYLGRATTSFNLTDADLVDTGASFAYTPAVEIDQGAARSLAGLDITFRHTPLEAASYNGFVWSTEVLLNHENRPIGGFPENDVAASIPSGFDERNTAALYSYAELKLSRRFAPGFLFDWAQDLDRAKGDTTGYSPYLSIWLSEFQRLRFQYTYLDQDSSHDNQFYIQWTAALGNHTHGFRER